VPNYLFAALTQDAPDETLFVRSERGDGLTYGAMRERATQVAAALVVLGVKPGDRVAAQIEKSIEGLMLYLGTVAAGAIFLPLNPAYTSAELDYFIGDAEPALVVCDPARRASIAELASARAGLAIETLDADGRGSLRDAIDATTTRLPPVDRAADDLAAILYTSGTTGRSKGAMLTHGNLVSNARTLAALWRFTPNDVLLHALPTYHTHGLFTATNTILAAGASLLFLQKFDAATVLAALPSATAMMGVPTFYTRLLDQLGLSHESVRTIRLFISGSAPLLAETHRAWRARTGHAILERYGMTETNMNCSNPYEGERRPGTVGLPLPGVSLRIADAETGDPLPAGAIGMIEVKGPNVFKGYWRNPAKTAAEFRPDGFFITGDLGTVDPDGYVAIVGRRKDLIITGGLNVYPKEVEIEIDSIDGVMESAVIGLPDADFGESVTAIVVPENGAVLDSARILAALDGRLARFKMPRRILFVTDLPRNAMGKVQKNRLRETCASPVS
jgi:malonyl-CoA/methylmalonyl-CoA synthetase